MIDQVALHDMAQRLRDAVGPDLGDAEQDVDEFLFVGEEGLAIELSLKAASRPISPALHSELRSWASILDDEDRPMFDSLLDRVPQAA